MWLSLLQLTEKVFTAPFDSFVAFTDATVTPTFDPETGAVIDDSSFGQVVRDAPDPTTIGLISLGLGIGFLLVGRWLDRNGQHGAATPFAVAGLPCLVVGVGALAPDLEASGTGLLMVVIGLALAYHGASVWRRATTWLGAATMAASGRRCSSSTWRPTTTPRSAGCCCWPAGSAWWWRATPSRRHCTSRRRWW